MNIAIVPARDSISGQIMVDPIGQSPLPIDAARIIFQNLKGDLHSLALVCKNWQALADDEVFYKMIRPNQAFGTKEWKEYLGVDAVEEPQLPRRAYGDLEKEGGLLTFIPDKVKRLNKNGKVEEMILDNLEAIGQLVENPQKGHKTGYCPNSGRGLLLVKRKLETPHWVWIRKEVIGNNKTYTQVQALAIEESKKIPGANISGSIDFAISVFMEYVRSGKPNFISDPLVKNKRTYLRIKETAEQCPIFLGIASSDLAVGHYFDCISNSLGIVFAWKSFDT